jgi:anti-sigma factor RsiW
MSCQEREAQLALHAGGDLPAAAAAELRAHLAGCSGCRRSLAALSETTDWLREQRMAARMAGLDRPLLDELQRRIARDVTGRRPAPWLLAWWGRLFEANRQPLGVERGLGGQPVLAMAGAGLLLLGAVGALAGGRQATAPAPAAVVQAASATGAPAASSDSGLRIEMQTGDPDVRIIWFAAAETGQR